MAAPALNILYANAIQEVNARFRFPEADNLITVPTPLEQKAAIFDALAEINSAAPETSFTLDQIFDPQAGDPRLQYLVYLGTGKNIIQLLVTDWTANGFSLSLEELSVEDRLDRYTALLSQLSQRFSDQLNTFKTTTQKFIKRAGAFNNPLVRYRARNWPGAWRY